MQPSFSLNKEKLMFLWRDYQKTDPNNVPPLLVNIEPKFFPFPFL